jgi:hypothetical protein
LPQPSERGKDFFVILRIDADAIVRKRELPSAVVERAEMRIRGVASPGT